MRGNNNLDKVILGTAGLGGVWGDINASESLDTIAAALTRGISALDTAPSYGDAEEIVGVALADWKGEQPKISTKVGRLKSYRADQAIYDYSSDGMQKSVEQSLKTLGISKIDVLFLHDPAAITPDSVEDVVHQMIGFRELGYADKIGLGGNTPSWFSSYLQNGVFDVVMEYNRLNACSIDALDTSLRTCLASNKEYYAASPLNMGLLGCNFNNFSLHRPDWLLAQNVEQAKRLQLIATRYAMELDVLALRFLNSINEQFKIVIGPSDTCELNSSLKAIGYGALPVDIYEEILNTFN